MYYVITQILFWLYWMIATIAAVLVARELFRTLRWQTQVTAILALIPLLLRVFFLK